MQRVGLECLEREVGVVMAENLCEGVRTLCCRLPVSLIVVDAALLRLTPREHATLFERVAPACRCSSSVPSGRRPRDAGGLRSPGIQDHVARPWRSRICCEKARGHWSATGALGPIAQSRAAPPVGPCAACDTRVHCICIGQLRSDLASDVLFRVRGACTASGRRSRRIRHGGKALHRRPVLFTPARTASGSSSPERQRAVGDGDHRSLLRPVAGIRLRGDGRRPKRRRTRSRSSTGASWTDVASPWRSPTPRRPARRWRRRPTRRRWWPPGGGGGPVADAARRRWRRPRERLRPPARPSPSSGSALDRHSASTENGPALKAGPFSLRATVLRPVTTDDRLIERVHMRRCAAAARAGVPPGTPSVPLRAPTKQMDPFHQPAY